MPNGTPQWKVTNVTPHTEFVQGVGPVNGALVAFETTSGLIGTVFVAQAQTGDTQAVAAAIQRKVNELDAIHKLSG